MRKVFFLKPNNKWGLPVTYGWGFSFTRPDDDFGLELFFGKRKIIIRTVKIRY